MICASCGADAGVEEAACPKCEGATLLDGRYRLLAILGRGANGITYRAERISDGAAFAIKEMPLRTLENAKAMELFDREARVLRELDHPSIPKYEDDFIFGEGKSSALYLVQELVDGETLADEAEKKRYTPPEVFSIIAEIGDVLDYLHRRSPPVVHRDVKPKNVMRRRAGSSNKGELVLIDFGSVRDALSKGGGSTVAGTFGFMAPEQLAGKASPASDVYGLGALAVALLTREEPDTLLGDDHRIDVRDVLEEQDVSEGALELLESMLDPNPTSRPARGGDVAKRARSFVTTTATTAAAPPGAQQKKKEKQQPKRSTEKISPSEQKRREERWERKARERAEEIEAKKKSYDDKKRNEKAAAVADAALERETKKSTFLLLGLGAVMVAAVTGIILYSSSTKTTKTAQVKVGVPELYSRPVAIDANLDGVEDIVAVFGVDRGPEAHDDEPDTWGKENGRFDSFVQAIDGKTNKILWAVKQGKAYTSLGNEAQTSERILLLTLPGKNRIAIARVSLQGKGSLTIHDLKSGEENGASVKIDSANGRACQGPGAIIYLASGQSTSGLAIDLDNGTAKKDPSAKCDGSNAALASATIADVPESKITNKTTWSPRFTHEVALDKPPYAPQKAIVTGDNQGLLLVDTSKPRAPTPAPTGITIEMSNDVSESAANNAGDNTKVELTSVNLASGGKSSSSSLASLGLMREVVDHMETISRAPPQASILLFFTGSRGLALVNQGAGKVAWSLPLPKGHTLSSYTLSPAAGRAYLHVFAPDPAIYGFLSKKLGSRILVVDLKTGRYINSIPEGSYEPDPPPAPVPTTDIAAFRPVAGCVCETSKPVTLALPATKDAGPGVATITTTREIGLGMYMRSSTESGGRKRFGVSYALLPSGEAGYALPHYNERRDTIAPPKMLEGEVSLGVACDRDMIVYAADKLVTAWSLTTKDELWTTELAAPRAEAKTVLGAGASLTCAFGRVERDNAGGGRVIIPATDPKKGNYEIALSIADGSLLVTAAAAAADAGAKKR